MTPFGASRRSPDRIEPLVRWGSVPGAVVRFERVDVLDMVRYAEYTANGAQNTGCDVLG
jgi:hypothetical protein